MRCPLEQIFSEFESSGNDCDEMDENMESPGNFDFDEIDGSSLNFSPGMTYVPVCDPSVKIFVGQKFKSLEDGMQFYKAYGAKCGFVVRLGPHKRFRDGSMKVKEVYCNRQGEKPVSNDNEDKGSSLVKKRKSRVSKRVGCEARVVFKSSGDGGYYVSFFEEKHCHMLVSDVYKEFTKGNKNLEIAHKLFIMNCARANIGATKSYRLFKEFAGGYSNIGCTKIDFKNFARDLKAYVVGADAQMLLNKMYTRRESCSAFIFEYEVDEKDQLKSLFWADAICRRNYAAFGDVVSFDATYSTNRYNMIFCPFTGKDNHGKCVTFGVGLLPRENVEQFSWLFEKFKQCMGRSPTMIITDHDPAMKIAIERVLIETVQRLCMWHILRKLPDNVPVHLKKDDTFKVKLKRVVYSNFIEPLEFDGMWEEVMSEFGLTDNVWFKKLFDIRENRIPAYFRDLPMNSLLRTTSLSGSENGFFNIYSNHRANLVEFFMNTESALDSQRRGLNEFNAADEGNNKETQLAIENHAADIYTAKIFYEVQEEIASACFSWRYASFNENDNTLTCEIDDYVNGISKSCMIRFMSHLCVDARSLFGWTKSVYKNFIHDGGGDLNGQCITDERKLLLNQILYEFYACVGLVEDIVDSMSMFLFAVKQFKEPILADDDQEKTELPNQKIFDDFYGSSIPDHVAVLPPQTVKNKGSGSRKKSRQEDAIIKRNKPPRTCSVCEKKK